mgnify:CR=1 FL=1
MFIRDLLIISNNPLVKNIDSAQICFVEGGCREVLNQALQMAAAGYSLLSHPLAGNVQMHQNPYRSILMGRPCPQEADPTFRWLNNFLDKIEEMEEKQVPAGKARLFPEDLQFLDFELLSKAMER